MELVNAYARIIAHITELCGGSDKFAHTYIGLAIWLVTLIVTRRPLTDWRALVPLMLLEGANEVMDRLSVGSWMPSETLKDIAATLFWPVTIILLVRIGAIRLSAREGEADRDALESSNSDATPALARTQRIDPPRAAAR
ncbi:hypothetical protein [Sphingomonas sp. DT-204]|uniref:hypothetical protein n=1 Tax=Sphingomonas sp. DT-204 TaxID=3396166 RepID=UPI003F1C0D7B